MFLMDFDKEWRIAMGIVSTGAILRYTKKCEKLGAVILLIGAAYLIIEPIKDMRDYFKKDSD